MSQLPARPAKPLEANWPAHVIPAESVESILGHVEKPVYGGELATSRRLKRRLIQDGERQYTAYSADELIELDSQAHHGRPGMPY